MSAAKHTPGPWVAKYASDGCRDIGIVFQGGVVAECFHEIRKANEGAHDECLANARLIATAPELLDMLIEVLDKVPLTDSTRDAVPTAAKARALIAKATGAA